MKNKKLIIATFVLLFSSDFSFGQIDLGTAASFAMFTSVGAFDNVGESNFIGDIGTHAGAITGFPPGTVTGQIYQEDPTTLQASADVEDAYNYLTGVPCDSTIGDALGGGQVLTPFSYCVLTAASLVGELILDGENDPDALFIIKITGVFDVIGFSEVTLINSASASNVYWQVDGAVNVGDSAFFQGTILANGALNFAEGSVLDGRGLSRQGAISTISMNASVPHDGTVPITLIKFEGKNMHSHNLLSWSTASEINNDYFTVERTMDGVNYRVLTTVNGAGTDFTTNNYTYTDDDFERKINYYRLTQTDYDGQFETFKLIFIDNSQASKNIIKIFNLVGQEVTRDFIGSRVIYFSNGENLKINGKYVENQ